MIMLSIVSDRFAQCTSNVHNYDASVAAGEAAAGATAGAGVSDALASAAGVDAEPDAPDCASCQAGMPGGLDPSPLDVPKRDVGTLDEDEGDSGAGLAPGLRALSSDLSDLSSCCRSLSAFVWASLDLSII